MVLHGLEQRVDGLMAEIVVAAGGEGVSLVDEEHAAERRLDDLLRFQRGLPDEAGHQAGAVRLDQLALAQHADGGVEPRQDAGHRGLAGAGVAEKDEVQRERGTGKVRLSAQLADLDEVHEALDVLLDVLQADQVVELGHERFKVRLLLCALLRRGLRRRGVVAGLHGQRVLVGEARLVARHIIPGIERDLAFFHAAAVADGGELFAGVRDVLRFGKADVVVHGGERQENVGQHPDEDARIVRALLLVLIRQRPEEEGRQEIPAGADLFRQLPEQPLRHDGALGVELIDRVHMLLRDAAAAAPELQRAVADKAVQLSGEAAARHLVKCLGVGDICLMQLLRGALPAAGHFD